MKLIDKSMNLFKNNKLIKINAFLDTFKISKKSLLGMSLLMLVMTFSQTLTAGLFIPFLNSFQNATVSSEGQPKILAFMTEMFNGVDPSHRFVSILYVIVILTISVQVLTIYLNKLILRFSMFDVQNAVANDLYGKIIKTPLKFFFKETSGELINHLTINVNKSYNCIRTILLLSGPILFVTGYFVIGFFVMPIHTGGLFLVLLIIFSLLKRILPYIYNLSQSNVDAQNDANNIIVESLQGIRSLTLSNAQKMQCHKFKGIMALYYSTLYKSGWMTLNIPFFIKIIALILVGAFLFTFSNEISVSNPAFVSKTLFFVFLCGNIFQNLAKINALQASFAFTYKGLVALMDLNERLKAHTSVNKDGNINFECFKESLVIKNVQFSYIPNKIVLDNISISIKKGTTVAIVGSSGSGKSTIIDIISGFYDDYVGYIGIDGIDFCNVNKKAWRDHLGYVSQESFIFNDTVVNNLKFGLSRDIGQEELEQACKNAQVYDTIMDLEQTFETRLGERGVILSGGEKQRLAIARLFLKDPEIVLLDEATSALDSESEYKVKKALNTLAEGRTVIAIAHRLSTISDFDIIYVLDNGKILEKGTHKDLMAKDGKYCGYYKIQSVET